MADLENAGRITLMDILKELETQVADQNARIEALRREQNSPISSGGKANGSCEADEAETQASKSFFGVKSPRQLVISVIDQYSLVRVLNLLKDNHEKNIIRDACWIVSNITAGSREQIKAVINRGIMGPIIHFLQNADLEIKKEAARALSNALSGGSPDQIEWLVVEGCIKPLCDMLECDDLTTVLSCLKGLESILAIGKYEMDGENEYAQRIDEADGLEKILKLRRDDEFDVSHKAFELLDTYWSGVESCVDALQSIGSVMAESARRITLEDLLKELETQAADQNARIETSRREENSPINSGEKSSGSCEATEAKPQASTSTSETMKLVISVIDQDSLVRVLNLLKGNHEKNITRYACWIISNITAGSREQIKSVIDCGIMGPIIRFLQNAEFEIKKEAAWALSNALSGGSPDQIEWLVVEGCIKPLCDMVVCDDPTTVFVCLKGLESILAVGKFEMNGEKEENVVNEYAKKIDEADGVEKILKVRRDDDFDVSHQAFKLLGTYWREDERYTSDSGCGSGL